MSPSVGFGILVIAMGTFMIVVRRGWAKRTQQNFRELRWTWLEKLTVSDLERLGVFSSSVMIIVGCVVLALGLAGYA